MGTLQRKRENFDYKFEESQYFEKDTCQYTVAMETSITVIRNCYQVTWEMSLTLVAFASILKKRKTLLTFQDSEEKHCSSGFEVAFVLLSELSRRL